MALWEVFGGRDAMRHAPLHLINRVRLVLAGRYEADRQQQDDLEREADRTARTSSPHRYGHPIPDDVPGDGTPGWD